MDKPSAANCAACPYINHKLVPGCGAPPNQARAVIVGESPGLVEARYGAPFIGQSGRLIRAILNNAGFTTPRADVMVVALRDDDLGDIMTGGDVYYTNAALCLPPRVEAEQYKTSKAKKLAAICCKERLLTEIKPYLDAGVPICAVGGSSSMILAGNEEITKIRGMWHQDNRVLTTWHPAYILRQPSRVGDLIRDIRKLHFGHPRYLDHTEPTILMLNTPEKVRQFTDTLIDMVAAGKIQNNTVAFDIESDNIDWRRDQMLSIQFSWDVESGAVITDNMIYQPVTRECLMRIFDPANGVKLVGHNAKFDARFLYFQLGVWNVHYDYDSLLADYALDENRMHALKVLLTERFDLPDYEQDWILKYLKNKNDRYSKAPRMNLYQYGVWDTAYTLRLWHELRDELEEADLFERPFMYPLMAAQPAYLRMEMWGMLVDTDALDDLSVKLRRHLTELRAIMEDMAGREFNPNSYLQVGRIMYEYYEMPRFKAKTKIGWSTAKAFRQLIEQQFKEEERDPETDEPFKWLLLYNQWKTIEKLRNSYVDNLRPHIDKRGRVHPDILAYGTETGRPSVRDPALQTIPRTGTGEALGEIWGKAIKMMFVAPPGYKIVQVDYSQAELRTAAWLSKDPFLLQCYLDGRDIHGEVAEAWWPGWKEMTYDDAWNLPVLGTMDKKTMRVQAKKGVFMRLYLGTEHALGGILGCSSRQAKPYLKALDERLGGLVGWEEEQWDKLRAHGYVTTLTGRRRRVPLITRANTDDARKAACNAPVQGMASELVQMALIEVITWLIEIRRHRPEFNDVHVLITVHDSMLLEVPDHLVKEVSLKVKSIMEAMGDKWMPGIPWIADIEVGQSWGGLESVEWT